MPTVANSVGIKTANLLNKLQNLKVWSDLLYQLINVIETSEFVCLYTQYASISAGLEILQTSDFPFDHSPKYSNVKWLWVVYSDFVCGYV